MSNLWNLSLSADIDYNHVWGSPGGDLSYLSDNSPISMPSYDYHASTVTEPSSTLALSKPSVAKNGPPSVASSFSNYHVAQENGQRIFGPPLNWIGSHPPERATEVFVGKIPRDCFENELIPLFERPGRIYKMRLMIDFLGNNRGYGFVQYFSKTEAQNAITMLNGYKLRKNWQIGVMFSKNNNRLFFGNLPNNISRAEMYDEISKYTSGILNVVYYGGAHRQNGFGFVEYENHKQTALARRKFFPGSILLFGRQPKVDWAKSEEDYEERKCQRFECECVFDTHSRINTQFDYTKMF